MVALAATQLLNIWERAWSASPTDQALALLETAHPELSRSELLKTPVGLRDGLLLKIREQLFGHHVPFVLSCPECGEQIELELSTQQLKLDPGTTTEDGFYERHVDGYRFQFRVPNSGDLLAISSLETSTERVAALLSRCVQVLSSDGLQKVRTLSSTATQELMAAMDEVDPQANVEIPVTCVNCQHNWSALFDIVAYMWTELDAWAQRTLNEIHLLASAYGWTQDVILELTPARRQLYVNMVRA